MIVYKYLYITDSDRIYLAGYPPPPKALVPVHPDSLVQNVSIEAITTPSPRRGQVSACGPPCRS